jgi:hypothetical protein
MNPEIHEILTGAICGPMRPPFRMESAVRGAWVESASIAYAQKQGRANGAKVRLRATKKAGCQPLRLTARNGIFGCGDRATEIAARDDGRPQRPKGSETGGTNPGRNSLSEHDGKIPRTRPRTWDPLIKRHADRFPLNFWCPWPKLAVEPHPCPTPRLGGETRR